MRKRVSLLITGVSLFVLALGFTVQLQKTAAAAASPTYYSITSQKKVDYDAKIDESKRSDGVYTAGPYKTSAETSTINTLGKQYDGQTVKVLQEAVTPWTTTVQVQTSSGTTFWIDKLAIKAMTYYPIKARTTVNYPAVISEQGRQDGVYTDGPYRTSLSTYEQNSKGPQYEGQKVQVLQTATTSWSTYIQVKTTAGQTFWIDKLAVEPMTYYPIKSQKAVNYSAVISQLNRQDGIYADGPYRTSWSTYDKNSDGPQYDGQKVQVTHTATTSWSTYAQVKTASGQTFWIDTAALVSLKDISQPVVTYVGHVQNKGWQSVVTDNALAGTTGQDLGLEGLRVTLANLPAGVTGGVAYSAQVQNIGWQSEASDGAVAGITGKNTHMEAIRMRLTGAIADTYSIYYRVHVSNLGWTQYAKDGAIAGSVGMNWAAEGVEIELVKKTDPAPKAADSKTMTEMTKPQLSYSAHSANIGWGAAVGDGQIAGTTGRALQVEAMKASLSGVPTGLTASLTYSAYVANKGWVKAGSDGSVSGTTGQNLQEEAFNVKLTGTASSYYDVWYQAYIENYGWLGWTKNGGTAGSSHLSLRVEAFRIKVQAKGSPAPGSTKNSYIQQTSGWRSVGGQLKYYNAATNSYTRAFKIQYYSQLSSAWAGRRYGNQKFGATGCGQASIAMIISGFGIHVTPSMAADYSHAHGTFDNHGEVGSAESDLTMVAEHYGVNWHVVGSAGELSSYLAKGYPATVCLDLGGGVRHIVVLSGYSIGVTNVSDPWNGMLFSGRHSVSQIWSLLSWKADNKNKGASAAVVYIAK